MVAKNNRRQRGYTLLEYCAGAAVVAGVLWGALNSMGENISTLMNSVGRWATTRATALDNAE